MIQFIHLLLLYQYVVGKLSVFELTHLQRFGNILSHLLLLEALLPLLNLEVLLVDLLQVRVHLGVLTKCYVFL